MSTEQTAVAEAMETSAPNVPEVQNNGHDSEPSVDVSPSPKKAKVDEAEDGQIKRRSSGRPKKNRDEEMLAEAKKLCGELDTSGGRSMRKRAEPPKSVEKKKEPVSRRASKKSMEKGDEKVKEKEISENGTSGEGEEKADKSDNTNEGCKEDEKKEEKKHPEAADNTTSTTAVVNTDDKPPASDSAVAGEKAVAEPVVATPAGTEENKSAAQSTDGLVKESENGVSDGADATAAKE